MRKNNRQNKQIFSFWITKDNKKIVNQISQEKGINIGDLLNLLIEKKLSDPVIRLKEERKQIAIRIAQVDEELNILESLQDTRMQRVSKKVEANYEA